MMPAYPNRVPKSSGTDLKTSAELNATQPVIDAAQSTRETHRGLGIGEISIRARIIGLIPTRSFRLRRAASVDEHVAGPEKGMRGGRRRGG